MTATGTEGGTEVFVATPDKGLLKEKKRNKKEKKSGAEVFVATPDKGDKGLSKEKKEEKKRKKERRVALRCSWLHLTKVF